MSITIENSFSREDPALNQRAHFIPCHIAEDGPANVKTYFEPYVKEDDNGLLNASLRGRPLDGTLLPLPTGHVAVLLTEAKQPLSEDAQRKLQVSAGFCQTVYWNYDKQPSKNDALIKAMDWIEIAEAMNED